MGEGGWGRGCSAGVHDLTCLGKGTSCTSTCRFPSPPPHTGSPSPEEKFLQHGPRVQRSSALLLVAAVHGVGSRRKHLNWHDLLQRLVGLFSPSSLNKKGRGGGKTTAQTERGLALFMVLLCLQKSRSLYAVLAILAGRTPASTGRTIVPTHLPTKVTGPSLPAGSYWRGRRCSIY